MDTVAYNLLNEEARRKERGMTIQSEANIVEIVWEVRLVEKVEVEVMTNLEGNLNLAPELLVTIVASWVTRNLNAKFSKEIRRLPMSSQTKLTPRRKKRNALQHWR